MKKGPDKQGLKGEIVEKRSLRESVEEGVCVTAPREHEKLPGIWRNYRMSDLHHSRG